MILILNIVAVLLTFILQDYKIIAGYYLIATGYIIYLTIYFRIKKLFR